MMTLLFNDKIQHRLPSGVNAVLAHLNSFNCIAYSLTIVSILYWIIMKNMLCIIIIIPPSPITTDPPLVPYPSSLDKQL